MVTDLCGYLTRQNTIAPCMHESCMWSSGADTHTAQRDAMYKKLLLYCVHEMTAWSPFRSHLYSAAEVVVGNASCARVPLWRGGVFCDQKLEPCFLSLLERGYVTAYQNLWTEAVRAPYRRSIAIWMFRRSLRWWWFWCCTFRIARHKVRTDASLLFIETKFNVKRCRDRWHEVCKQGRDGMKVMINTQSPIPASVSHQSATTGSLKHCRLGHHHA